MISSAPGIIFYHKTNTCKTLPYLKFTIKLNLYTGAILTFSILDLKSLLFLFTDYKKKEEIQLLYLRLYIYTTNYPRRS